MNRINKEYNFFPYLGAKGGEIIITAISELLHSVDVEVYLEPFAGSAKVFSYILREWRSRVVSHLNDKNGLIANLWKCIATNNPKIREEFLEKISISHHSSEMHRIARQEVWPYLKGEKKVDIFAPEPLLAWATWFLLCASFNGLIDGVYGIRKKGILDGSQTEPQKFQAYRDAMIVQIGRISDCQIHNSDALSFLTKFNPKTKTPGLMAYIDPPYTGGVNGKSTGKADQGWYGGYTETDLVNLLDFLSDEYQGNFILSNYPSAILDEHIERAGWKFRDIEMLCNASSKGGKKIERLVWNFDRRGQRKLFQVL